MTMAAEGEARDRALAIQWKLDGATGTLASHLAKLEDPGDKERLLELGTKMVALESALGWECSVQIGGQFVMLVRLEGGPAYVREHLVLTIPMENFTARLELPKDLSPEEVERLQQILLAWSLPESIQLVDPQPGPVPRVATVQERMEGLVPAGTDLADLLPTWKCGGCSQKNSGATDDCGRCNRSRWAA